MQTMTKSVPHKVGEVETAWRLFRDDSGHLYRIQANYGFRSMNGPGRDHFGIGGTVEMKAGNNRWYFSSCGCLHDEVAKHFPELEDLIRWHGTAEDGPMHYGANGMFWWDRIGRPKERACDPDAADAFRSTTIFGALADDAETYPGDPIRDAYAVRVATKENADPFGVHDGARDVQRLEAHAGERRAAVLAWLEGRRERLMAEFWRTMAAHGLAEVK